MLLCLEFSCFSCFLRILSDIANLFQNLIGQFYFVPDALLNLHQVKISLYFLAQFSETNVITSNYPSTELSWIRYCRVSIRGLNLLVDRPSQEIFQMRSINDSAAAPSASARRGRSLCGSCPRSVGTGWTSGWSAAKDPRVDLPRWWWLTAIGRNRLRSCSIVELDPFLSSV
jgi:hypothetical protein